MTFQPTRLGNAVRVGLAAFGVIVSCLLSGSAALAAELSVRNIRIRPGATRTLVVMGSIHREETYGVTIMLELVGQPDNVGTVTFTPVGGAPRLAPGGSAIGRGTVSVRQRDGEPDEVRVDQPIRVAVDILQLGDPWPERGSFSAFDTGLTLSKALNGALDDNGTFLYAPVSFTGSLAGFPVVASPDARGTWNVTLTTSGGGSGWEGVGTALVDGTITVVPASCLTDRDCVDTNPCTMDRCRSGVCRHVTMSEGACVESHLGKKRRTSTSPRRPGSSSD